MNPTWHLEHSDGREWTYDELEEWRTSHSDCGLDCEINDILLSTDGDIWFMDWGNGYCLASDDYYGPNPDMRAVFDE